MKTMAVTGSREMLTGTELLIKRWVDQLQEPCVLLHGGAKGVDRTARDAFKARGWTARAAVTPSYSAYPSYLAPLIRNAEMLSQAEQLVGFWHGAPAGGTANTLWCWKAVFNKQPDWFLTDTTCSIEQAEAQLPDPA